MRVVPIVPPAVNRALADSNSFGQQIAIRIIDPGNAFHLFDYNGRTVGKDKTIILHINRTPVSGLGIALRCPNSVRVRLPFRHRLFSDNCLTRCCRSSLCLSGHSNFCPLPAAFLRRSFSDNRLTRCRRSSLCPRRIQRRTGSRDGKRRRKHPCRESLPHLFHLSWHH